MPSAKGHSNENIATHTIHMCDDGGCWGRCMSAVSGQQLSTTVLRFEMNLYTKYNIRLKF